MKLKTNFPNNTRTENQEHSLKRISSSYLEEKKLCNYITSLLSHPEKASLAIEKLKLLKSILQKNQPHHSPFLLPLFPSKELELVLIILSFFQNFVRVICLLKDIAEIQTYYDELSASLLSNSNSRISGNLRDWLHQLNQFDSNIASSHYSTSAKLLLRLSLKAKRSCLYPTAIQWFTLGHHPFKDLCLTLSSCPPPSLISILTQVLKEFESNPSFILYKKHTLDFILPWCELLSHELSSWITQHLSDALVYTQNDLEKQMAWHSIFCRQALLAGDLNLLRSKLNAFLLFLKTSTSFPTFDNPSFLTHSNSVPQQAHLKSKFFLTLKLVTTFVNDMSKFTNSLDTDDFDNPYNSSYKLVKKLIHDTLSQLTSHYYPLASYSIKISRCVFEWLLYLALLLMRFEGQLTHSVSYIERATDLLSHFHSSQDQALLLPCFLRASHLLYQNALQLKEKHAYSQAKLPSQYSVQVLQRYISNNLNASNVTPEIFVTLAKRLELLATLSILLNEPHYLDSLVESVLLLVKHDPSQLDGFLLRHVQREFLYHSNTYHPLSLRVPSHRVFYAEWKALFKSQLSQHLSILDLWRTSLIKNLSTEYSSSLSSSNLAKQIKKITHEEKIVLLKYSHFLLCSALSHYKDTEAALSECKEAIEILKNLPSSLPLSDVYLDIEFYSYKNDFLATLYCLQSLLSNEMEPLRIGFQLYKSILNDNESTTQFYSKEQTFWLLTVLENLLLSQSRYNELILLYQVKLLLALNDDTKADILIKLSHVYLEIGFQGPPETCLTSAKSLSGEITLWKCVYATHLTRSGHFLKSRTLLQSIHSETDDVCTCHFHFSWILLQWFQGKSLNPLKNALDCLEHAKKLNTKWYLLQTLFWISSLYFINGMCNDSEAYAQQGRKLAKQLDNEIMESKFLLILSKLHFFKNEVGLAKELLETDSRQVYYLKGTKEYIHEILFLATILLNEKTLSPSNSVFQLMDDAKKLTQDLKSAKPPWIQNMEIATPRLKKLLLSNTANNDNRICLFVNVTSLELELILLHSQLLISQAQALKAEKYLRRRLDQGFLFGTHKPIFYLNFAETVLKNLEPQFLEHPRLVILQDAVQLVQSFSSSNSYLNTPSLFASHSTRSISSSSENEMTQILSEIYFVEDLLLEALKEYEEVTLPFDLTKLGHCLIYLQAIKALLQLPTLPLHLILEACCHGVTYKRLERIVSSIHIPTQLKSNELLNRFSAQGSHQDLKTNSIPSGTFEIETNTDKEVENDIVNEEEPLSSGVYTLSLMDHSSTLNIPNDWCICRLALDKSRNCMILAASRSTEQVVLRLPIGRFALREGEQIPLNYLDAELNQFFDLISQNDSMLKKTYVTSEDKLRWWSERNALNQSIFDWLVKLETVWFGSFRGLLLGHYHPDAPSFSSALKQFLQSKVEVSVNLDIPLLLIHSWMSLGSTLIDSDFEDMGYFILDELQKNGIKIEGDVLDPLIFFLRSILLQYEPKNLVPCQHTVIVLDKHLCSVPFESMPIFHHHSVSRVFSMYMLQALLKSNRSLVHRNSVYYLLNPSRDLQTTEDTFSHYLIEKKAWNGSIGNVPCEKEFLHNLTSHDLFLYFGHGGAENICSPKKFQGLRLPVTFLMGCSSGKLHCQGEFDPMGTVIHYMTSKSPCLVANLWDVTDKDIDRFAYSALSHFGIFGNGAQVESNLSTAVAKARDECRFRYLIGAAPVVFGIPVHLIQ